MSRTACTAVLTLALISVAPLARAADLFTVPGVINNRDLGTFILCTSTDSVAQTVEVDAIDKNGAAAGTGTYVLRRGQSVMFGTRPALGLDVDVLLHATKISKGTATISSTSAALTCSAFVADAAHTTPLFGVGLNIVADGQQKGN